MTSEKAAQPTLETILRPGQTVAGKYCVDHLIAAGGMAAVWAGINLRTGKRVALKVILRSFAATPGAEELFRREALAASRINHPNVVTVFDVVDHASRTCIVMEFLDGEDLGACFERQGPLGLEAAVELLLPAMRGVAAANGQGVVHRDLKPKNIFLCIGPDGRLVTTKILDFGISVIVEKTSEPRSKTVQLITHGTPAYMSPEHIVGSPNIDERADVYGFGVILFEALTGQPPFVGPAGTELLTRILEDPAPKLTRFRPDISPRTEAIIERAIAKNPDHRFPTLNHFIAALEEEVLPRSAILRSLTPVVGVPLIDTGSGPRGVEDSVVRVLRRAPSAEQDGSQTKALYTLARTPPPPTQKAPAKELPPTDVAESASRPPNASGFETPSAPEPPRSQPGERLSRHMDTGDVRLGRRSGSTGWKVLAIPASVAIVTMVVAWLVIPARPQDSRTLRSDETTASTNSMRTPTAAMEVPKPPRASSDVTLPSPDKEQPVTVPQVIPTVVPADKTAIVDHPGQGRSSSGVSADEHGSGMRPPSSRRHLRKADLLKLRQFAREHAHEWTPLPLPTPAPEAASPAASALVPPPVGQPARRAGALSTDDF